MTPETQTTISVALSQMYDKGIDHAIQIVSEEMYNEKNTAMAIELVNSILIKIIGRLENLKAKG